MSTAKVYAGEINFKRCKEKGDYNLRAVIQDNNIDLTTSIGQVLTTVEMEGGSWDFTCDSQSNHATFDRNMYIGTGNHTWSTPWSYDSTVCIIPGLSGIGIRFYTSSGSPKVCNISVPNGGGQIVKFDSGTVLSGTASYSPFAELIRIGDINAGKHVLPSTMPIAQKLRTASNGYSFDNKTFKLVFTNPTLEAHLCTMVQFNQTIDFGSGIARGDEVISKPFDVWLTDCSGEALTEYKNSAKLTFASSPGRISPDGTQLYNCNDDDCADGAYITFTDIEGDAVDLKTGYRLNAQTTDNDYKLSFSSNLHTENTTGGKIDTSLTLVINYL
ncbi:fimbrial protein [Shewanella sp. MBTL60-007]|uniref:fimbrial protein n=1 Tax=Shewanella sp. MBTL60-007 TaxID=2815911 RepID=UPI001BC10E85|nr:hypothetical protein [Shewanella sp. MBTL60-007]GIU12571.1 hypothetical protein TUM3792_01280 [Shewanella sp. MBTL60-007]